MRKAIITVKELKNGVWTTVDKYEAEVPETQEELEEYTHISEIRYGDEIIYKE